MMLLRRWLAGEDKTVTEDAKPAAEAQALEARPATAPAFDFDTPSPDPDPPAAEALPQTEGPPGGEDEWAEARVGVAEGQEGLHEGVVEVIRTCYDPEIPVNIYELGLIYDIGVDREGRVWIDMTLTSPACPVAGSLPGDVMERVRMCPGVKDVHVELVWDPPWNPDLMSDAAKLELGML